MTSAFFSSKPGASLLSSEPDSAIVSRVRAKAEGLAAVMVTRLPPGALGFRSRGFDSAGLAAAGFVPLGRAPDTGGAATAVHVPRKTVTENVTPNRIFIIDSPVFRARQYHDRSSPGKAT